MQDRTTSLIASGSFTLICGVLALVTVLVSPTPMPTPNVQLLTVFLGLMSAGGTTFFALVATGAKTRRRVAPRRNDALEN